MCSTRVERTIEMISEAAEWLHQRIVLRLESNKIDFSLFLFKLNTEMHRIYESNAILVNRLVEAVVLSVFVSL